MLLIPIHTQLLKPGDDIVATLLEKQSIEGGDIIIVSSKAIATVENAFIDLSRVTAGKEAKVWSDRIGRSPEFCQAVLEEVAFWSGKVVGHCPGALLTELRPQGLPSGSILTANAGLDQSNAPEGTAIGWPKDVVKSALRLKQKLESFLAPSPPTPLPSKGEGSTTKQHTSPSPLVGEGLGMRGVKKESIAAKKIATIITDSCCRPRRLGVTAFALAVAGIDPLVPQAGREDLYGRRLRITTEAIADQLATAGNFLMGNAAQATPAVIVRDHGLPLSDFVGWVPGIEKEEDLFCGI